MDMYLGPSAATGIGAGAGVFGGLGMDSAFMGILIGVGVFTLIGAFLAVMRILPRFRSQRTHN